MLEATQLNPSHEILCPLGNYCQKLHVAELLESATARNLSFTLSYEMAVTLRFIVNTYKNGTTELVP